MGILSAIAGFASTLAGPAKVWIEGWQTRKTIKTQNEARLAQAATEAKIRRLETAQEADIAWENTALNQSGIKDEVMMFIVCAPLVACFIPGGDQVVAHGFQAINENIPGWWVKAFFATLSVSYGIRKFQDVISFKKGVK